MKNDMNKEMFEQFISVLHTNRSIADSVERSSKKALVGILKLQANKSKVFNGSLEGHAMLHSTDVKIKGVFLGEDDKIMVECAHVYTGEVLFVENLDYIAGVDVYDIMDEIEGEHI